MVLVFDATLVPPISNLAAFAASNPPIVAEIDVTFLDADHALVVGAVEVITIPDPSFLTTDLTAVSATASVAPNAVATKVTDVLIDVAPVDNENVTVDEPAVDGAVNLKELSVPASPVVPTAAETVPVEAVATGTAPLTSAPAASFTVIT
jgi:hypothetical protein